MDFELVGRISEVETIATGRGTRELKRLKKAYGPGRWRKCKGVATIRLGGELLKAEVHWYEGHGIGRKELKVKRLLEQ